MNWRKKLYNLVKPELAKLDPAHQIEHSLRVYKNCEKITKDFRSVNLDVLYVASLLHDIGQTLKDHNEHSHKSIEIAEKMLEKSGFPMEYFALVKEVIGKHDDYIWVKNHSNDKPKSIEAKIFQDADRLESIGVMGIIRQFLFSGKHNKKIYDDKIPPQKNKIYAGNVSAIHTIRDHELQIYKYLNTRQARILARNKYIFAKQFLNQFFKEWKQ
jgi:uncharacterized protein